MRKSFRGKEAPESRCGIGIRKEPDMESKKRGERFSWLFQGNLWENIGLVIMAFYPLRHIGMGLDLWDTGYNYANFQYMGTEHMDPMWLFSTYLANVAGNMLTKLPNGGTLMGMNLYTGLFVSILALTGYFFCTRKLKMPKALVFAGEMLAVSLCWCPTALLYNYLTYVLFLAASILLFIGLTEEKKAYLAGAGVLLGTNVLVRFSNVPEAGMILAVWAYDFLFWRREKKNGRPAEFWARTARHTLWCLAGYLAAVVVLLNYIHVCYGFDAYIGGIRRLFAMTDKASDYKPTAMIMGIVGTYVENLYWVVRIGIIILGGMALFAAARWAEGLCRRRRAEALEAVIHMGVRGIWCLVSGAVLVWLYKRKFCSFLFYSYDSMLRPGILFLMLTMLIAMIRIFWPEKAAESDKTTSSDKRKAFRAGKGSMAVSLPEEKLISGMLILIILLTSLGSNNGVYPSLNNLFLAAPYTLWQSWRFIRFAGDGKRISCFPAKGILAAFLAMCLFQFGGFGAKFVFAEATGIREADACVENNPVLRNIRMSAEKARWMEELSAFAEENRLQGREVILYGNIPSLSYYLQMPSAFNPWSDLDSYSLEAMESDLAQLFGRTELKGVEKPIVIVENTYAFYEEEKKVVAQAEGALETEGGKAEKDPKWKLLAEFMEETGYENVFKNEKFAVYQAAD